MYKHKERTSKQQRRFTYLGSMFFITISLSEVGALFTIDCGESSMKVHTDDQCLVMEAIPRHDTILGSKINYQCASLLTSLPSAQIDYCPVQICTSNGTWTNVSLSCASNECFEIGLSEKYRGKRSCTASGIPCQPWANQSPHSHKYNDSAYFLGENITEIAGYCRDPDGRFGQPWCYTSQSNVEWEHCDVPYCSTCDFPDLHITTDNSCTNLADIPILSTSIGATIIFTCQSFQTNYVSNRSYCPVETCESDGNWTRGSISCAGNECYKNGESSSYTGFRNCTESGRPCIAWKDVENNIGVSFTDSDSDDPGNFCRDPEGLMTEPYCFVDTTGTNYETCGIQKCDDFPRTSDECDEDNEDVSDVFSNSLSTSSYENDRHETAPSTFSSELTDEIMTRPSKVLESSFSQIDMNTQGENMPRTQIYSNIGPSFVTNETLMNDITAIKTSLTKSTRQSDAEDESLTSYAASSSFATKQSYALHASISSQQVQTMLFDSFESGVNSESTNSTLANVRIIESTQAPNTPSLNQKDVPSLSGSQNHSTDISPSTVQLSSQIISDVVTSKPHMQTSTLKLSTTIDQYTSTSLTRQTVLPSGNINIISNITPAHQTSIYTLSPLQTNSSSIHILVNNDEKYTNHEQTSSNSDVTEKSIYNSDNKMSNANHESRSQSAYRSSVTERSISGQHSDNSVSEINITVPGKSSSNTLIYSGIAHSSTAEANLSYGNTGQESSQQRTNTQYDNYHQTLVSTSTAHAKSQFEITPASVLPQQSQNYQSTDVFSAIVNTTVIKSTTEFSYLSHTPTHPSDKTEWQSESNTYNISPSPVQMTSNTGTIEDVTSLQDIPSSTVTLSSAHKENEGISFMSQTILPSENDVTSHITSSFQTYLSKSSNIQTDTSALRRMTTNMNESYPYYEQSAAYSFKSETSIIDRDNKLQSISEEDHLLSTAFVTETSIKDCSSSVSIAPRNSVSINVVTIDSVTDKDYQHTTARNTVTNDGNLNTSKGTDGTKEEKSEQIPVPSESEKMVLFRLTGSEAHMGIHVKSADTGLKSLDCARKCSRSDSCYSFDTNVELGTCKLYTLTETNGQKECPDDHVCYGRI